MTLHHTDKGSGPPVILIHGYPLNRTIWNAQLALADRFRILIPDLPGFGDTPPVANLSLDDYADLLVRWMDELGIERSAFVGHSMGGYVLLSLADRYGDRMEAMTLVCSQAGGDASDVRELRLKTAERVRREGTSVVIDAMIDKLLAGSNAHLKSDLRSIMETATPEGVDTALRAMAARSDRFHVFSKFTLPVLIVSGRQDTLIGEEKASLMADRLKMGRWVVINDCGHMPMLEQPERLNAELRAFLSLVS